jgi:hypothetical protein
MKNPVGATAPALSGLVEKGYDVSLAADPDGAVRVFVRRFPMDAMCAMESGAL